MKTTPGPFHSLKQVVALLVLFILGSTELHSQFYLTVGDPRSSWWVDEGTIEKASISMEPQGLFTACELILEFSSEGSYWTQKEDTVEVVLYFQLPEDAVVYDSWLWIEDEPVRAEIMDRWTASFIYEGVVKRRRDPSMLIKNSPVNYQLRIFPMAGNETRTAKISYLMPGIWSKQVVATQLPLQILQTSKNLPDELEVTVRSDASWGTPFIVQYPDLVFLQGAENAYTVSIPSDLLEGEMEVGFAPPGNDGFVVTRYGEGSEGIYQLALFPSDLLDTIAGNKLAVLVDFDEANTGMDTEQLLEITMTEMLKSLTANDSFNLIYSNLSPKLFSDQWEAASASNIRTAFDYLKGKLANYSNLGTLIASGVEFIRNNGGSGQIMLVSNADQFMEFSVANNLIEDILSLMSERIPIHISDYQSTNYHYIWHNDRIYTGNEYFYMNLSRQTRGTHQRYLDHHSTSRVIGLSLKYSGGFISSFDLHTGMENGFCHSRYLIQGDQNRAYVHEAILQVGKFKGDFPMKLELSGEYNEHVFNKTILVSEAMALAGDTLSQELWTGQYISELEAQDATNDVINEILYHSLSERVLSRYTAFLCLEPGMVIDPEDSEDSEIPILAVEEIAANSDTLWVYPNPFVDYVTIELDCADPGSVQELSVYSLTGALICHLDAAQPPVAGRNVYSWNGCYANGNSVEAGMYLLVYVNGTTRKTVKLVKQ
jgi:hypothetical protein